MSAQVNRFRRGESAVEFNLTPKQLEVARFIAEYRRERKVSPTLQEIGDHFGVSKITIYEHVQELERKGAIRKERYRSRAISLDPALEVQVAGVRGDGLRLPLLGRIAAGTPIEAIEAKEEIDLGTLVGTDRHPYVLEVKGDSMIEDHIRPGDFVVVEPRTTAQDGETVVAIVNGNEATLKRLYREPDGRFRLQPANGRLSPLYVQEVEIRGVVIGVIRRYA